MSQRNKEEEQHCCAYAEWCALQSNVIPELKLVYHIPNGGARPWQERIGPDGRLVRYSTEGQRLRKMGVKKGVLDYHLPVGRYVMNVFKLGLWIEFKSQDGKLTPEQEAFKAAMEQQGHMVLVVRDWEQAKQATVHYLGFPEGAVFETRKQ